jgi:hypothetical protein
MRTALQKRPGAQMAVISTAGQGATSPLGQLRARALAGDARRRGAVTEARTESLRMLEWSVDPEVLITDTKAGEAGQPRKLADRRRPAREKQPMVPTPKGKNPKAPETQRVARSRRGRALSWPPVGASPSPP